MLIFFRVVKLIDTVCYYCGQGDVQERKLVKEEYTFKPTFGCCLNCEEFIWHKERMI